MSATTTATAKCSNPLGQEDPPIHILLALQGGGALGAFEVGVLEHLHHNLDVSRQIKAVSGVSFGAINTAIYAANIHDNPIGALKEFYNELTFTDSPLYQAFKFNPFKNTPWDGLLFNTSFPANVVAPFLSPNFYNIRTDVFSLPFWSYLLDNSRLSETLSHVIDLDKLNSPYNPQVVLTALNIESGELEIFDNRTHTLRYEHVLASASLPPVFSPTTINNSSYWDGGVFDNSPFMTLLTSLNEKYIWDDPDTKARPTEKRLVTVELASRTGDVPQSGVEAITRLLQVILRTKFTAQTRDQTYEFGTVVNWLTRFLRLLAFLSQPGTRPSSGDLIPPSAVDELLGDLREKFGLTHDKEVEQRQDELAKTLVLASQKAMDLYFNTPRPGAPIPQVPQCPTQTGASVTRLKDWTSKRLSVGTYDNIRSFVTAGQGNTASPETFRTYFDQLRESAVFVDQVTRFANIELYPIMAIFDAGILGIADYSASSLRSLYETGVQIASQQILVSEYTYTADDGTTVTKNDLQYIPLQQ